MKKHFLKTISQQEIGYGFFTKLPKISVVCHISPSPFILKSGTYLRKNIYSDLNISQQEYSYAFFTKPPKISVVCHISPSSIIIKSDTRLRQNKYSN